MVIVRQTGNIKKNSFEYDAWSKQSIVVGLDEVGRGCFAGPVVAAAVILPINKTHRMLKDSKIMTQQEREAAFKWIKKHCIYGIGVVHHRMIDQHNIWHATLIAMKKALMHALQGLSERPSAVITDAMPLNLSDTHFDDIPVYFFTKGESRSSSIAAASIIAKVIRDDMMKLYDQMIPGYGLAENKGYGTPKHQKALLERNYSFIHRENFVHNFFLRKQNEEQLTLNDFRAHSEPVLPHVLTHSQFLQVGTQCQEKRGLGKKLRIKESSAF